MLQDGADKQANANANANNAIKIFTIPFCAYCVQIFTTSFEFATFALFDDSSSSLILSLMYSVAEYAPVVA